MALKYFKYSFIIIVLLLLFGIFRGIVEGMVMTQPMDANNINTLLNITVPDSNLLGVRSHAWYTGYHFLHLCAYLIAASIGYYFSRSVHIWYTLGIGMTGGWELFELVYSYTRNCTAFSGVVFENVSWAANNIMSLHIMRISIFVTLSVLYYILYRKELNRAKILGT